MTADPNNGVGKTGGIDVRNAVILRSLRSNPDQPFYGYKSRADDGFSLKHFNNAILNSMRARRIGYLRTILQLL